MESGKLRISEERIPRESVFGLDAPPAKVLDFDNVRNSVYQGDERVVSPTDRDVRLRCLQGWFFRSSWSKKYRFVMEICELTTGVFVLEQVLKCVDGIYSKDVIDSFARDRILFPYDIVPTDDNRSMTTRELFKVRQEDTLWFLTLDSTSQVEVIVKLLKLGGGGLIFNAYKEINRMYRERKEMNMVLMAVEASLRDLDEDKRLKNEGNGRKALENSEEGDGNKYTTRKGEQINRRNSELNEFRKKYGLTPGNGKKREPTEVVDYMQVLPLWLNRKIMLYLNERELGELKRTGKYWTKMIEDSTRESTGRVAIDAKIGRMGGCDAGRREENAEESEDTEDVAVWGRDALLSELHLRHSDVVRARRESRAVKEAKMEVTVWEEMCFERIVCCVNESCKVLAASTPNKSVVFYSLRTGVRMRNIVTRVPSLITSMAIHDEGFHVIIGCEDGTLLCVNIRKNERTITYRGHSGPVLRVHVSDDKLISAAEDRTIKHFDLWSGLCLFFINIDDSIASMIVLKRDLDPRRVIAGTAQGKLVFIDLKKKKIYREVVAHEREVKGMTEAERLLVTHSADRSVRLWSVDHVEMGKCEIRPFASIRLKSVATFVESLGNEIFAACADGRLRLICKLTGAATRVVEVTQKKPIAGIYVMQEKDTTKMIMWHEGGIEMRSFSSVKVPRKKHKKATERRRKDSAPQINPLTPRRLFSLVPEEAVRVNLPEAPTLKRYKPTNVEDREKINADRSCTVRKLRDIGADKLEVINQDIFTKMMKALQVPKDGELVTFPRLQSKEASTGMDTTSVEFTDESSI